MESVENGTPPVVVIGAGPSGLTAIKCCLEQKLDVVCFEKTSEIGGLWRFREKNFHGVASVMRSTIINSSKEMSAYSDFPPPSDFPNFMHNKLQAKYFDLYAEKFELYPYIIFEHEILSLTQCHDFESSGQWNVLVKNLKNDEERSLVASAVMICSGHHAYPHIPEFPGLSEFQGHIMHTHFYKDYRGFEDKRVVIIGIGNSGGDVAVELSRISDEVYLSTRRGSWVIHRVGSGGLPTDIVGLRRFLTGPNSLIPTSWIQFFAELLHNLRFDHRLYNLKPKHGFFQQHPMVNDSLPNCLLSGRVIVKSDVHRFTSTGVVFQGEEDREYPVDAVILATGYDIRFPFVDSKLLTVDRNKVHLFKYVFEPKVQPPTLAVIGLVQPLGSIVPISEMQCRWAARVFRGEVALPSKDVMEEDIARTHDAMAKQFVESQRHTIQVDYMRYMDDVAGIAGFKPDLWRLFFADPVLWFYCMFGALVPYQYRLFGPHPWEGAREAIIKCSERVRAPLQTRHVPSDGNAKQSRWRRLLKSHPWVLVLLAAFTWLRPTKPSSFWAYVVTALGILAIAVGFAIVSANHETQFGV